ncbi:hypothetical protein ASPBRDRAFT_53240 [Aspergillus brasiliensis CBS 101740]|uniref:Uncharacterized protein n=1 Tax=Aspergillus brasiliensis (strain CBS 101740 / IMI 381727 / IBT 21946) TaxID=767769 RepID=A0A1L9UUA2_ASPBC|nr:hypothetical protein ASPBRDRAFT_53240 [Aspergillus brasiliensis CBS 101740]
MPRERYRGRVTQETEEQVKPCQAAQQHEGELRPKAKKSYRAIVGIGCWLARSVHPLARVGVMVLTHFFQRRTRSYCKMTSPLRCPMGDWLGIWGKSGYNQRHGEKKRNRRDPRGGVTSHVHELSVIVNQSNVQMTPDRDHVLVRG